MVRRKQCVSLITGAPLNGVKDNPREVKGRCYENGIRKTGVVSCHQIQSIGTMVVKNYDQ